MASSDKVLEGIHKELYDAGRSRVSFDFEDSSNARTTMIGMQQRRKVMGDAYVDNALAKGVSEFAQASQDLVTEACWGMIWTRPGLSHQQRSLINIAMISVLGK